MKKILSIALIVVMIASFAGCDNKDNNGSESIKLSDVTFDGNGAESIYDIDTKYTEAITDTSFKIFRECYDSQGNSMVSPYSIIQAFSMCANGTDGKTLEEIESAFGMKLKDINIWSQAFYNEISSRKNMPLSVANSFWYNDDDNVFTVNQDFADEIGRIYNAESYKATFNQDTANAINKWVSEKTKNRIDKVIDNLNNDEAVVLVNALAFDGNWLEPFDEESTIDQTFTEENGDSYDVKMMHSHESTYLEGKNYTGFIKPYEDSYTFMAFLPKEGTSVNDLIDDFADNGFNVAIDDSSFGGVDIAMPKFESEYEVKSLIPAMEKQGINSLFDQSSCDLSKMGSTSSGNLYISEVIHKTYIKVNEKGTEAAAVTGMIAKATALPLEPHEVILDRPFVYVISDEATGTPIFIGTCMSVK